MSFIRTKRNGKYLYRQEVESYRDVLGRPRLRVLRHLGPVRPPSVQHLEGDCLELIPSLADASVDVLITDPPYSVMADYEWDKKDMAFYDTWLTLLKPKLKAKHSGFIFCDSRRLHEFEGIVQKHFTIKNRIMWIRKNLSMGRIIKGTFISSYEVILYFGSRELNLPKDWGNERFDSCEFAVPQSNFTDKKVHPTQKPLELITRLVKVGSYKGDVILDCFAGSGVLARACNAVPGRYCILMEENREYNQVIKGVLNELGQSGQGWDH